MLAMDTTLAARRPTKEDRMAVFRRSSWQDRLAMRDAIAACKAEALEARRALGRALLARQPVVCDVPFERAVAQLDMTRETAAAREEAVAFADGASAQYNNGSLEFPVLAEAFPADSEAIKLATSPMILAPITQYCGMLPVLFNLFVTRAHTEAFLPNSAHMFHLDPEDVISFKVFIHLTDVDDDCGPFHALHADKTQQVIDAIGYHGIGRITDEQVADLVGWEFVHKVLGPPGTVAFADTTRCLHFGGRPRRPGKPVRDMLVFQYLLPTSLLFPIDGDARHPRFIPQLEANGDPHWDALIGATHT